MEPECESEWQKSCESLEVDLDESTQWDLLLMQKC